MIEAPYNAVSKFLKAEVARQVIRPACFEVDGTLLV